MHACRRPIAGPGGTCVGRLSSMAALLLLAGLLTPPAHGEAAFPARVRGCAELADDRERLACFDAIAADSGVTGDAPYETATVRADPERDFGVETLPPGFDAAGDAVDVIASRIEDLQRRPHGEYVFELANGQRWTQLESGRARYRTGQRVTIERTTLGAYMLSTDQGRATRVRRLD
jgi:hypothetical protein